MLKRLFFGQEIETEVLLDLKITDELKQEGALRELIRFIQDLRKKEDLDPSEKVSLSIRTDKEGKKLIGSNAELIKRVAVLREIVYEELSEGSVIGIGDVSFVIAIRK